LRSSTNKIATFLAYKR